MATPAPIAVTTAPPSGRYRWAVLVAMSLAVYGSYYAFDAIGPLAPVLSRELGFSDSQIGLLQASYSLPNVVVLLAAGLIIDRVGARRSMTLFAAFVFGGLVLTALGPRLGVMVSGRLLTGIGSESLAMATHVAIARWFLRGELSLAFGVRTSFCRLGSLTAQTSPTWAAAAYAYWRWPILIAVAFGACSLAGALLFSVLDRRGERRFEVAAAPPAHRFAARDLLVFNRSFWLLAALCAAFYGCIFPFQTFGQKYLIEARHLTPQAASLLVGMEPLCALLLMPLFGHLVDRRGHRSLFMMLGAALLVPVFPMLALTDIPALVPMALMGIAFSMVPAVLWMAIVFVVDRARLGFASAVVDVVQQAGLVTVNLLVGWSNDRSLAGPENPGGYGPGMWLFTVLALAAVACAAVLRRVETGPGGHGLETIRASAG